MHVGLKLTKQELKDQKNKLAQLNRFLPILKLRKSLIEQKLKNEQLEIAKHKLVYADIFSSIKKKQVDLFVQQNIMSMVPFSVNDTRYENIAGVMLPVFSGIVFSENDYSIFATSFSTESTIKVLKSLIEYKEIIRVCIKRVDILQSELRKASIRYNLIEKVLIPQADSNISRIKIFLMDMELASVGRAKIAKQKRLGSL